MAVNMTTVEVLQMFVNQIECNQTAIVLFGLLASKVDPDGSDESLKQAFAATTAANMALIQQLRKSVDMAKEDVRG